MHTKKDTHPTLEDRKVVEATENAALFGFALTSCSERDALPYDGVYELEDSEVGALAPGLGALEMY